MTLGYIFHLDNTAGAQRTHFFRYVLQIRTLNFAFSLFSNTLRVTKAAALQGLDGSEDNVFIGKKGRDFEFSQVLPVKVDFVECSAKGQVDGDTDLSTLEKWLENLA